MGESRHAVLLARRRCGDGCAARKLVVERGSHWSAGRGGGRLGVRLSSCLRGASRDSGWSAAAASITALNQALNNSASCSSVFFPPPEGLAGACGGRVVRSATACCAARRSRATASRSVQVLIYRSAEPILSGSPTVIVLARPCVDSAHRAPCFRETGNGQRDSPQQLPFTARRPRQVGRRRSRQQGRRW